MAGIERADVAQERTKLDTRLRDQGLDEPARAEILRKFDAGADKLGNPGDLQALSARMLEGVGTPRNEPSAPTRTFGPRTSGPQGRAEPAAAGAPPYTTGAEGFRITPEGQAAVTTMQTEGTNAAQIKSFAARTDATVAAVAAPNAALAIRDLKLTPQQGAIVERTFARAAADAANLYQPAFDAAGEPIRTDEAKKAVGAANSGAADVAFNNLGPVLNAVDPRPGATPAQMRARATDLVDRARFGDVVKFMSSSFGVDMKGMSEAQMVAKLKELVPENDYFREAATKLTPDDARASLPPAELKALSLGLRLANDTWASSQVNRVAYESTPEKRSDRTQRDAFRPFDLNMAGVYDRTLRQTNGDAQAALLLAAFEAYKDADQLRGAAHR
jgi:hypothetical protein